MTQETKNSGTTDLRADSNQSLEAKVVENKIRLVGCVAVTVTGKETVMRGKTHHNHLRQAIPQMWLQTYQVRSH